MSNKNMYFQYLSTIANEKRNFFLSSSVLNTSIIFVGCRLKRNRLVGCLFIRRLKDAQQNTKLKCRNHDDRKFVKQQ